MSKPKYQHDCQACIFLGNATLNGVDYDLYVHEYSSGAEPSIIYRDGDEGHEYGSSPISYITPFSPMGMVAFSLYLERLGVNGANGSRVGGSFFKDGKLILKLEGN